MKLDFPDESFDALDDAVRLSPACREEVRAKMGLFKKFVNQTRKPEGMLGKLMYPERFCEEVVRFLE